MFGSRHFQALKNGQSVGCHIFSTFFILNFFTPSPRENQKKRKQVSGDLFRDLEPLVITNHKKHLQNSTLLT